MAFHVATKTIYCGILMAVFLFARTPEAWAEGASVRQVIEAIKHEINMARVARNKQDSSLEITSVDVILTAVAIYEGEIGVRLEVPIVKMIGGIAANVGGKLANTQTVSLTLIPEGDAIRIGGMGSFGLLPAIENVKAALRQEARDDFRLALKTFDFEIQFAITKTVQGNISFIFIDVGKAKYENLTLQRIIIHMRPSK